MAIKLKDLLLITHKDIKSWLIKFHVIIPCFLVLEVLTGLDNTNLTSLLILKQCLHNLFFSASQGAIAGIVSAVAATAIGAVSSFIAYQKKKLCFKQSGKNSKLLCFCLL